MIAGLRALLDELNHPARILFRKWQAFADERKWSELFTSMLEETGILFHERESNGIERLIVTIYADCQ